MGKQAKQKDNRRVWLNVIDLMNKYKVEPPLELVQSPDFENLKMAFAEKVALFISPLDKEWSEVALREGTRAVSQSLDYLLNLMPKTVRFADHLLPLALACTKGCNYCCTIRVTTVAPQILTLAHYLRKKLGPVDFASLLTRIEAFEEETTTLGPLEQVLRASLCPLNVEGLCIGYTSRPSGCIAYHSFNLQKCIDDSQNPAGEALVPQDPQRLMFRGMHTQALNAGMTALGLDTTELEFIPALRIALLDDEVGKKYLDGEAVFALADRPEVRTAQQQDMASRFGNKSP